jgi:hypothetical protein
VPLTSYIVTPPNMLSSHPSAIGPYAVVPQPPSLAPLPRHELSIGEENAKERRSHGAMSSIGEQRSCATMCSTGDDDVGGEEPRSTCKLIARWTIDNG